MARKTTKLSGSLTIRLDRPALRRLQARAREAGRTPSEFVRQLLESELGGVSEPPALYELTRSRLGVIDSADVPDSRDARREIERWNPSRRR